MSSKFGLISSIAAAAAAVGTQTFQKRYYETKSKGQALDSDPLAQGCQSFESRLNK